MEVSGGVTGGLRVAYNTENKKKGLSLSDNPLGVYIDLFKCVQCQAYNPLYNIRL